MKSRITQTKKAFTEKSQVLTRSMEIKVKSASEKELDWVLAPNVGVKHEL